MANTPMQEMFDLNTAIDQLKSALTKDYNFEVKPGELECSIHVFCQSESYPEVVQDAFTEFNRRVKQNLQTLIDSLIEERDKMTMQILANQSLQAPKNDIHNEIADNALDHQKEIDKAYKELNQLTAEAHCDGIDCATCLTTDCPKEDKPSK